MTIFSEVMGFINQINRKCYGSKLKDFGQTGGVAPYNSLHTHSNKTALDNVSNINSGDQDLSGLVPNTITINGKRLNANQSLNTLDIPDVTNKRYITDAQNLLLTSFNGESELVQTGEDGLIPLDLLPQSSGGGSNIVVSKSMDWLQLLPTELTDTPVDICSVTINVENEGSNVLVQFSFDVFLGNLYYSEIYLGRYVDEQHIMGDLRCCDTFGDNNGLGWFYIITRTLLFTNQRIGEHTYTITAIDGHDSDPDECSFWLFNRTGFGTIMTAQEIPVVS